MEDNNEVEGAKAIHYVIDPETKKQMVKEKKKEYDVKYQKERYQRDPEFRQKCKEKHQRYMEKLKLKKLEAERTNNN